MPGNARNTAKPVTYNFWINLASSESPTQGSGTESRNVEQTPSSGFIWRKK